jgi:[methyl-Co(III) methanol-specific corrinoid protein]:coenzyme M methyltransferase
MVKGKPDDVEDSVKDAIDNGVNAIWPGCDIFPTVPRKNMESLIAATQKYGKLS